MKLLLKNRKAKYNYEFLSTYEAGLILTGTEIKSLRAGNASLSDSYCYFNNTELFLKGLRIEKYRGDGGVERDIKLLLHKKELKIIKAKLETKGLTIVPVKVYLKGHIAKIEICLAKGKKLHDKRNSIKERDIKRELDRNGKET